jgi:hypothetical protein
MFILILPYKLFPNFHAVILDKKSMYQNRVCVCVFVCARARVPVLSLLTEKERY